MLFTIALLPALLAPVALARSISEPLYKRQNDSGYSLKTPPLDTPWTADVGTNPWPEHPRPLLKRDEWKNLNGVWKYQAADSLDAVNNPPFNAEFAQNVLVPSCLESGLSGLQGRDLFYSWLSTSFEVPSNWTGDRVLLNFGAVDYEATVFVNGKQAGFHRGGYFAFTLDITDFLGNGTSNELLVFVHDPTDSADYDIPIGKQTLAPSHIFYVSCSGIWQSVFLESAPANYVTQLDIDASAEGEVTITASTAGNSSVPVSIKVLDGEKEIGSGSGQSGSQFKFTVDAPKLWAPNTPNLYDLQFSVGDDSFSSYTGFRTYSKGDVNGIPRHLVNGEFLFKFGTLDQGFWPDGLYTPPTVEAMRYDLEVLKKLGFNMVRKHIKVEPALFYRACDELGLMVIQDMPSLKTQPPPNAEQQAEFERQIELLVNQHKSYPSISTWVIYNEGWGQFQDGDYPEFRIAERIRELDGKRLIDATSGWNDHGAGDYHDNHHYANPQCGSPFYSIASTPYDGKRVAIQGEFGGVGHNVSIEHLWNVQQAINTINQTYEIDADLVAYNYRSHRLLDELKDQIEMYACSGAVWTQTTDVEGEVNGLLTYDRRVLRTDEEQWKNDIQALYDAAAKRGGGNSTMEI